MQDYVDWSEKNHYKETSYYKLSIKENANIILKDYGVSPKRRWGQITQMKGTNAVKGSTWDIAIERN